MSVLKEAPLPDGRTFRLVVGDLLHEPVDAIVNAANGSLAHGGGVAAAIANAAGPAFDEESSRYVEANGVIPTGEAAVTGAGRLAFQGVIHAVGPRQGQGEEREKLAGAVADSLLRAHERGWTSVAFPAISSGIFAVPLEVCAGAYIDGVQSHFAAHPDSTVRDVRLCVYLGPIVDLVETEMNRLG